MSIKIEMLRTFATVVQSGTLTEAAARLGRTQSAVSMTLKQLEMHLGKRLFESDRKNRLTPLGQQVFELAQTQVRQFDSTIEAIEAAARSPAGQLRIAAIPSIAGAIFPTMIEALTRKYPGLTIDLRDTDSAQVIDAMLQGRADIGVVSGTPRLNSIRRVRLFADRFGVIVAPGHPLARQGDDPTLEQVVSEGFVHNNLCSLIEDQDMRAVLQDGRVSVHNTMSLISMVRTGHWTTVLTRSVQQSTAPDLVFRPIKGLEQRRPVSALMREGTPFPDFAEELWKMLIAFDWTRLTAEQTESVDRQVPVDPSSKETLANRRERGKSA